MVGSLAYDIDDAEHHSGRSSARILCRQVVQASANSYNRSAWGRFYQAAMSVRKGQTYRLSAWIKTSRDFRGQVLLWCDSNGVSEGKSESTNGEWRQVVIDGIKPGLDTATVYINLVDSTGTVWIDDVRLE